MKIKVHPDKRYLMYENGEPFFYLGDTAWDMINLLSKEEIDRYFYIRAKQGFTVIQMLTMGDWYFPIGNAYGAYAIEKDENGKYRPDRPILEGKYSWWDHLDFAVECAQKHNLVIALLPMWQSMYSDPKDTIFSTPEICFNYGKFLAERYKKYDNIIWMLGGDCSVEEFKKPIIKAVYDGIKSVDDDKLVTFHPGGLSASNEALEGCIDVDFNTCQSGHSQKSNDSYKWMYNLRAEEKPYLDSEPHYEDHVANWEDNMKTWDGDEVRESAYSSLLEGAAGNTYGNPYIAFFFRNPMKDDCAPFYFGNNASRCDYFDALFHDGGVQAHIYKDLRLSRPYFELRPCPELVLNSEDDLCHGHIAAARGDKYAFIYAPLGQPIKADFSVIGGHTIMTSWFNPRTGEVTPLSVFAPVKSLIIPPSSGKGNDWVLICDVYGPNARTK